MSTVKTPTGQILENVHGQELDYYRGEGYEVLDDAAVESDEVEAVVEPEPVVEEVPETVDPLDLGDTPEEHS